jgi:carbon storage regulator
MYMLVLTRRANYGIVIGGKIRVTVVAIEGNKVRLGVTAPDAVRVDRQEVHARRIADGFTMSEVLVVAADYSPAK